MKVVKVNSVEEILEIKYEIDRIEIAADVVIRYIYFNKDRKNVCVNIEELRNVYAKSIKKSYAEKRYSDDIIMSLSDVKKVCYS